MNAIIDKTKPAAKTAMDGPDDLIDGLIADWSLRHPSIDASSMAVVGRILILARRLEARVAESLKPFELHYSDFDVLATLRRSGAPYELAPKQLIQSVLLTSGGMTALLDRLTDRGYIKRGHDKKDGRVRTAILTSAGKTIVDKAVRARFEEANQAITCLDEADRLLTARSLKKMGLWLEELDNDD